MRWNSGPQAPSRVVFVINSLEGGGAERVLSLLLERMETLLKDCDSYLILLDRKPEAHSIPAYINVIRLDCQGSLIKSTLSLRAQLKQLQPDVVLSFLNRANCANVLAARTLPYHCILSERVNTSSHFGDGLKGRLNKLIVRALYPLAHQVLAVSQGVAADLRLNFRVPADQLQVIYNPYDLDQLQQAAAQAPAIQIDGPYIVSVGRLVANKNFGMLVRAYHQSRIPEKLVILGEGPERSTLTDLIQELGLQERVILAGFTSNPYAVMAQAAYAAFASSAEGFPNALAEAMALGLPVIATDCDSGPAEILHNVIHVNETKAFPAEYGVLVPVDDQQSMAQALQYMGEQTLRAHYSRQSRTRIAEFGFGQTVSAYFAALSAGLQPSGGGQGNRIETSSI